MPTVIYSIGYRDKLNSNIRYVGKTEKEKKLDLSSTPMVLETLFATWMMWDFQDIFFTD